MEEHWKAIIEAVGEDPNREGLLKTPERAAKAFEFLTRGYRQDVEELVNNAIFTSDTDEMVIVRNIELYSMCEHHMLPFIGKAHVAYLPQGKVIGLSKIARIVDLFARRLQIQEVLTKQIDVNAEPEEMLRTAIRAHLYLTEVMQKWFYFFYMETKNLDKLQQKKSIESELETEQVFIDILDAGSRKQQFDVENSVLTASVIKSMLQDWYLKRWKYAKRDISVDQYADYVLEFIENNIYIEL